MGRSVLPGTGPVGPDGRSLWTLRHMTSRADDGTTESDRAP